MPEVDEQVSATLNYKLRVARGNVRKFLTAATEGVDLGAYQDIVPRILGAVEQIEADTGAPLDAANDKGWKALQKRVEVPSPCTPWALGSAQGLGSLRERKVMERQAQSCGASPPGSLYTRRSK